MAAIAGGTQPPPLTPLSPQQQPQQPLTPLTPSPVTPPVQQEPVMIRMIRGMQGFGVGLAGGVDAPLPLHVQSLRPGVAQDAGLRTKDWILAVNGIPTKNLTHAAVINLLKNIAVGCELALLVEHPLSANGAASASK